MRTAVRTFAAAALLTVLLVSVWVLRPGTTPPADRMSSTPPDSANVAGAGRPREPVVVVPRKRAPEEPVKRADASSSVPPAVAHRDEGTVVYAALDWFTRKRRAEGGWGNAGATGLALLAYLGAGETPGSGSHREAIASALASLVPDESGRLASVDAPHFLRDHALASLALV